MAILEFRIRTVLDETAPQLKVAVRQALVNRDRALPRTSSNPVASTYTGVTPPTVGGDMPQNPLAPNDSNMRGSRTKARKVAVAVVCSPRPRPSARNYQLAGSLTEQDRTPRPSSSSTMTTSSSESSYQSSRSVSVIKIEDSSDEECFQGKNSDGDDDLDIKDSSSDEEDSSSDSDYVDVADDVYGAGNERPACSVRTVKTSSRASGLGSESGCNQGRVQVNAALSQHNQPARLALSTAFNAARLSRPAARIRDPGSGSSRKRMRVDKEARILIPSADPRRKIPVVDRWKVLRSE
ncbi:hypothetical protein QM012_001663 [Aureobasidium pullulans]|uniref:Uncharacterized protein n=1 Tax=Aureobasidium pullulans TaxID=5580 RepID=A0ABR0TEQ9_AURPU